MQDSIKIAWRMELGAPGIDSDPENPMRRAVVRLFEEGKPFSRLAMSFLRDEEGALRWFGVFVESAGGRIIFFPGFADQFDGLQAFRGRAAPIAQAFKFDHLSLEADRSKWHVTASGSNSHLGSPSTLQLGEGRVLWFGLSLAAFSSLRLANGETTIEFPSPASDSQRRLKVLHEARDKAEFPIFSLNVEHPNPFEESFWHVAVIVGPKGFTTYLGGELGFPVGSPYLRSSLPSVLLDIPIRAHRIELSPTTDLQVTLCPLPGSLSVPLTFTGTAQPVTLGSN